MLTIGPHVVRTISTWIITNKNATLHLPKIRTSDSKNLYCLATINIYMYIGSLSLMKSDTSEESMCMDTGAMPF